MRMATLALGIALAWNSAARTVPADGEEFQLLLLCGHRMQEAGNHTEARRLFENALRMSKRLDPASEADALACLGTSLMELGRLADAERVLVRCLALREKLWGPRNVEDLTHAKVLTSLGGVDLQLGRYEQADRRLNLARRIWETRQPSSRDPNYATCLNNIAVLRCQQSRFQDAARLMREAVGRWEESLPPGNRKIVLGMANLAGILSRLGAHTDADDLSSRALAAFEDRLELEPTLAVRLLRIRCDILRKGGRGREAKAFDNRARFLEMQSGTGHVVDISVLKGK